MRTPLALLLYVSYAGLAAAQPMFTERSVEAGCAHQHGTVSLVTNLEYMTGGAAAGDFDRDGWVDLFVIGGSAGVDRLFLNDRAGGFSDIAQQAGVDRTHFGSGAAVGDYDNDGDLDIYVTTVGGQGPDTYKDPGHNILYRNNLMETGSLTFTDVAGAAGVSTQKPDEADGYSPSFGDYDLDGDLDLAVAGWNGGNKLFRNEGDGTFTDVTASALDAGITAVRGFVPRFIDMDGDRYPELLWVGDFDSSQYYINNTDGTFTNATASSGTGLDSNGMGNSVADYDGDGDFDWYVSSRINLDMNAGSGNMLYVAGPTPHVYTEESVARGCNFGLWSWANDSQDFDHDTAVDIVVTNGFTGTFETDPTYLFMNDGTGQFAERAVELGIDHTGQGRGLLTADFDRDGDRDIVIICNRQELSYYVNDAAGTLGNSVTIRFDTSGRTGLAPDGSGTHVELKAGGITQRRYLDGGTNFLAQSELSVHFGIADATEAVATVTYADGHRRVYRVGPGDHTLYALDCDADLVPDGRLDFYDIARYFELFSQGHPQADLFHAVPGLTSHDIAEYMSMHAAGCE